MFIRRVCAFRSAAAASIATLTATQTPLRFCAAATPSGKGNFFAFYDLPMQTVVDGATLQKRYHALQKRVHPDRQNVNALQQPSPQGEEAAGQAKEACTSPCGNSATQPAYAQEVKSAGLGSGPSSSSSSSSVDISIYANAAYETLKDPYFRCRYLARLAKAREMKNLERQKGDATPPVELTPLEEEELIIEDDRRSMHTRLASPTRPLSDEFLTEMLLMNELIFGGDRNDAGDLARMKVLQADLKERNAQYFEDVTAAWTAKDMDAFFGLVEEWTYVHNALTHLTDRL